LLSEYQFGFRGRTDGNRFGEAKSYRAAMTPPSDSLFDHTSILPDGPIDGNGRPLEVLHDREYRVRAFRKGDDLVLIRGAVRDQKPPGLYIDVDPDPLTIHHMQIDIEVAFPTMEIVAASVGFETNPNLECPNIVDHYTKLVGLSISRGFTHKARGLFGGPRGCTHTTALLQAMAPVAIQCVWSMRASNSRRVDGPSGFESMTDDQRRQMWRMNLNACHVWAEDSEWVGRLEAGEPMRPSEFAREGLVKLGSKPDDWSIRTKS
jgi:hypothetical protein